MLDDHEMTALSMVAAMIQREGVSRVLRELSSACEVEAGDAETPREHSEMMHASRVLESLREEILDGGTCVDCGATDVEVGVWDAGDFCRECHGLARAECAADECGRPAMLDGMCSRHQ